MSEHVAHEVRDAPALDASGAPVIEAAGEAAIGADGDSSVAERDARVLAKATLEVEQAELVRSRDELATERDKLRQSREALDREQAELATRREAFDKERAEFEALAAAAPAAMRRGGALAPLPSAIAAAHSLSQLATEARSTGNRTALVRYLRARRS